MYVCDAGNRCVVVAAIRIVRYEDEKWNRRTRTHKKNNKNKKIKKWDKIGETKVKTEHQTNE